MDAIVRDAPERSRYEILVDGEVVGFTEYLVEGDTVVMPHTEVVPRLRRRGYAGRLVGDALDDLRAQGKQVVPICWYVREFIEDHEGYADLVA